LQQDLEEEIRAHVQLETERRIGEGEDLRKARTNALRSIRSPRYVKEATREVWALAWIERCVQDFLRAPSTRPVQSTGSPTVQFANVRTYGARIRTCFVKQPRHRRPKSGKHAAAARRVFGAQPSCVGEGAIDGHQPAFWIDQPNPRHSAVQELGDLGDHRIHVVRGREDFDEA
jgi:hypothetical protein